MGRRGFSYELKWGEAAESFEASGEVVGVDEVLKVGLKKEMGVVVVTSNGGVLDGAIHAFDLAVGPRMFGFSEAVIDVVLGAGEFEGMGTEEFAPG